MDKRELQKRRGYIAERLPEIMLEWRRLRIERKGLGDELATASPERIKPLRQRLDYVMARIAELKAEQTTMIEARNDIATRLKEAAALAKAPES
jgi:predicted transcriptional regulator